MDIGELPKNSGTLAGHLIEHAKSLKMAVATAPARARAVANACLRVPKEAVTPYRVLERLPGCTGVEVKLETETGRRNQIRV